MQAEMLVGRILDDEGITSGLEDPEARLLVEWLVNRAEEIAASATSEKEAWGQVEQLCKRARAIRQFVNLWCRTKNGAAAFQLAAAERFAWPLPSPDHTEPFDVLQEILGWEEEQQAV
jgi:hypothetical protein